MWIAPFVVFDGVHPPRDERLSRPGHTDGSGVRHFPPVPAHPDGDEWLLLPFIEDRSPLDRPLRPVADERSAP